MPVCRLFFLIRRRRRLWKNAPFASTNWPLNLLVLANGAVFHKRRRRRIKKNSRRHKRAFKVVRLFHTMIFFVMIFSCYSYNPIILRYIIKNIKKWKSVWFVRYIIPWICTINIHMVIKYNFKVNKRRRRHQKNSRRRRRRRRAVCAVPFASTNQN